MGNLIKRRQNVIIFLFFFCVPTILFPQQASSFSSRFHASIKTACSVNKYSTESPVGIEVNAGINISPFNAILLSFNSYEIFAREKIIKDNNSGTILGPGGISLNLFAFQYKFGLGNFNSQNVFQNIFISFGFGLNDWSDTFVSVLISPEYKIRISNVMSIPMGLKMVWAINPPDDNIGNWNFIGIHTGIQFN